MCYTLAKKILQGQEGVDMNLLHLYRNERFIVFLEKVKEHKGFVTKDMINKFNLKEGNK